MREFIANPAFAKNAQIALILAYVLLAVLFSLHKKTWPVALYYVGCFVKDTGVFALAFLMKWFHWSGTVNNSRNFNDATDCCFDLKQV